LKSVTDEKTIQHCKKMWLSLAILSTVIICAFRIFCKTILQIVLPIKRLAKPFYKSADYAGGQYILVSGYLISMIAGFVLGQSSSSVRKTGVSGALGISEVC
jgi:hypothetical protein